MEKTQKHLTLPEIDLGLFFAFVDGKRLDIKSGFLKFIKKVFTVQVSMFVLILGRRGTGKTDFALLIAEILYQIGVVKHIATNTKILNSSFPIEHIANLEDLEYWGTMNKGRKIFIFDEIADAMSRRRPMAHLTVELIKKFNKLRKHKLTVIATTISQSVLDKAAMDHDLLDVLFRRPFFNDGHKQKCKIAYYRNLLNNDKLKLMGIPATSVHFDSWDASAFSEKPLEQKHAFKDKDMELVYRWAKGETYAQLGIHSQQLTRAKRKIIPILIESYLHVTRNSVRG